MNAAALSLIEEVEQAAAELAAEVLRLRTLATRLRTAELGSADEARLMEIADCILHEEPVHLPLASVPLPPLRFVN